MCSRKTRPQAIRDQLTVVMLSDTVDEYGSKARKIDDAKLAAPRAPRPTLSYIQDENACT
jgi:hypothetical protein